MIDLAYPRSYGFAHRRSLLVSWRYNAVLAHHQELAEKTTALPYYQVPAIGFASRGREQELRTRTEFRCEYRLSGDGFPVWWSRRVKHSLWTGTSRSCTTMRQESLTMLQCVYRYNLKFSSIKERKFSAREDQTNCQGQPVPTKIRLWFLATDGKLAAQQHDF